MHVHPSLSLIIIPTIMLDLKHCQDGRWSYSARLVLIPQLSSHTLQGLQQAYCTASLSAVSRFVSWQIGPQRVVFTTNFINVTCNDYRESSIFCLLAKTFTASVFPMKPCVKRQEFDHLTDLFGFYFYNFYNFYNPCP